jgi:hypothetical protein
VAREDLNNISATLGVETKNMGWRVPGGNQPQRVAKHGGYIAMMTITVDPGGRCRVTRKHLVEKGLDVTPGDPRDDGTAARYTPFRILSEQYAIE